MTEIIVTRHGETEWNAQGRMQGRCNSSLTDKGRAQAMMLRRRLEEGGTLGASPPNPYQRVVDPLESHSTDAARPGCGFMANYPDSPKDETASGLSFDAIFTSPQKRALDTAAILRGDAPTPIIKEPLLCEIALGSWEGLTFDEARALAPERFERFLHAPDSFDPMEGGESFYDVLDRAAAFWDMLDGHIRAHGYERLLCVTHGVTLLSLNLAARGLPLTRLREFSAHNLCYCRFIYEDGRVRGDIFGDTSHMEDI